MADPGVPVGQTTAIGHVVDLPATVVALSRSAPTGTMRDSVSLAPVFFDPATHTRRHAVSEINYGSLHSLSRPRETCVVLESTNGILKGRFHVKNNRRPPVESFFDLLEDPTERSPLSMSDPLFAEDISEARRIYSAYISSH